MRNFKRLNAQHAAGAKAIRVYVCSNPKCEIHHEREQPVQCHCGGIEFLSFDSKTEAQHWAQLRMLEKRGRIKNLRRQVPFALYAVGPDGQKIKVSTYIADFVWDDLDGRQHVGDSKPAAGVDDLAALKLRIMEAQGDPVTLLTGRFATDHIDA